MIKKSLDAEIAKMSKIEEKKDPHEKTRFHGKFRKDHGFAKRSMEKLEKIMGLQNGPKNGPQFRITKFNE